MAIGTGNIWRFPRIVARNGGGCFLIPWLIFLFLWSVPLLMVEMAMGRTSRRGTVGSFAILVGRKFAWMGAFVGFCAAAIMFYYSVVMGWCLKYFVASVSGQLANANLKAYWESFASASYQPAFFHFAAMLIGTVVVCRGVVKGIEAANKILIPALFVLLAIGAARALTLPGAVAGLEFLFHPDWGSLLNYKVWLEALTQSAWSTGAGWGILLTYAVYVHEEEDIALNSFTTGLGNNSASLLAALAVIPAVFAILPPEQAVEVAKQSGPASTGLTFISMPHIFAKMPGGSVFCAIFFLALSCAALTSLMSMIELAARILMDFGLSRPKAVVLVGTVGFCLGLPSALNLAFLENQDWVWGIGLMVSGVFFACAVLHHGVRRFRNLVNTGVCDLRAGLWFDVAIRLIPALFLALLIWWFWQAIGWDRAGWWHPFKPFSVGTCLLQWGVVIALFVCFNRRIAQAALRRSDETSSAGSEHGTEAEGQ